MSRKHIHGAVEIVRVSLKTVFRDPQITIYPILALLFISITYPVVGSSIFHHWYDQIFSAANQVTPHKAQIIIGLVGFSAFYAAFVSAFFTCAVSAAVLASLEGEPLRPLYGLMEVLQNFFRVARFAVLSVFVFPIGIYAQRRELPRGIVGVLGSSITLHMANLAPAILTTKKPFGATVRDAISTLGDVWKEGLILKIGMYITFTLIVILPKLVQHSISPNASTVGWLVSLELAASGLVVFKVINSIFTTVLYYKARQKPE